MAGVSGPSKDMVNLLKQLPVIGKKGGQKQISASFQVSTTVTSAVSVNLGAGASKANYIFQPADLSAFAGQKMTSLPKFTGLTKAEPQLSADELREAIIKMAEKDKASGIQYMSNGPEITKLIEKHICSVSPDRQGIVAKGSKGMMIPADENFLMAQVVDEKTGKRIADYQPDQGWTTYWTKEENNAANPFYELYYETFYGRSISANSSSKGGQSTTVDYKA